MTYNVFGGTLNPVLLYSLFFFNPKHFPKIPLISEPLYYSDIFTKHPLMVMLSTAVSTDVDTLNWSHKVTQRLLYNILECSA